MVQERDYTPETLRKMRLGYENLFQEIKVVIKNSHLLNTLLTELYEVNGIGSFFGGDILFDYPKELKHGIEEEKLWIYSAKM